MTPITHRASDEFDERNHFLQVSLGMVSLAQRLELLVAASVCEPAAAPRPPVPCDDAPREAGAREGAALHAVLGLIAVARWVRAHLDRELGAPPCEPDAVRADPASASPPRWRELAR